MQRTAPDHGIIISCDFCGTDWEPSTGLPPMTEGHHGSVLCLECLKRALDERSAPAGAGTFSCTLCLLGDLPETLPRWSGPRGEEATVCEDCIIQAAKAFDRDPDVAWEWDRKKK